MVFEKIRDLIVDQFDVEENSVTRDTHFVNDLGADSLDVVELTMAMEEEFDLDQIPEDALKSIATVGDLVDYVENAGK